MATNIDLDTLSRYLDSDASPDDCVGLSKLDGFLAGIIAGPEPIPTDDWLPAIWGEATPSFQSTSARETIIGLIMGRHKEIAAGLNADPEEVDPVFDKDRTGERSITDGRPGSSRRSSYVERHGSRCSATAARSSWSNRY